MASKKKVDQEELKKDIEALKNAKTSEEIEAIMAKYSLLLKPNKAKTKVLSSKASKPEKGRSYNGKYEIYKIGDDYQYHLKASNGEILFVSELYSSKDGINKAINNLKKNTETGEFRITKDKKGLFKFKLVAKNHRVLAISSSYSQESSAERALESFKKFVLKADIVEIEFEDSDIKISTPIEIKACEEKQGGKFEIEKYDDEYSWSLKSSNGQILAQMAGFTSRNGVMNSINSFKKNVKTGTFKCVTDKNNNYCYKLYTQNGRVCAIGESYISKASAESSANSVVSFYNLAEIIDK